jgi:putative cell wall-binding protein
MWAIQKEIYNYIEELEKEQTIERKEEIEIKVKQLKDKKDLLEVRRKEVKERKEKIKKSYRESHQINIVEPDAYMMDLGYGKGYSPAYNTQISVDMNSQR